MAEIRELPGGIWQIDLEECGVPGRTCGYLVKGDIDWLLVETGPASSLDRIVEALDILNIQYEDLRYIGVTHIHLDHAGGVGAVARKFPRAKVLVQQKGARHLIDPSRLIKSAAAIWGEAKMQQFGPILPVPEEQVLPVTEGDQLHLGNRTVTVWYTPGHAKHHICFHDSLTNGLFSGDATGVYQPRLSARLNKHVIRTATVPPEFNGRVMLETLIRIALTELEVIYFTHFGALERPLQLIQQLIGQLTLQMELARKYYGQPDGHLLLAEAMVKMIKEELGVQQLSRLEGEADALLEHEWDFMTGLMAMSAAGCLQYLDTEKAIAK